MSAKMSGKRRNAFLKAFAQSGNLMLSAARAGMSKSWVIKKRLADPDFALACRAARAAAGERLGADGCNRPPRGWGQSGGRDLAVRRAGRRPAQVARTFEGRWTPRAEARFLGALTRSNNLEIACDEAGMTLSSYEAHHRRWPDFRRRVKEARAFGSERLEGARRAEAERPLDLDEARLEAIPPPTIAEAIALAWRHRRGGSG
jgi:hypothetical protein